MRSEESKDKTTDVKNTSVIIEIWKELLLATKCRDDQLGYKTRFNYNLSTRNML